MKPEDFYYPSAIEWMWDYCIPLGKFTDSEGKNYDLGIFKDKSFSDGKPRFCNATVYGNTPGNYYSGDIYPENTFKHEVSIEVLKRAKEKGIIKN